MSWYNRAYYSDAGIFSRLFNYCMTNYPSYQPPAPQRRSRSGLWAVLTFAALSLACLALLVVSVSGGRLPDLSGAEVSWTPPADVGTTALTSSPQPATDAGRFVAGDVVQNVNPGPVNLRQSPGYQNKPANDVIMAVPAGAVGAVLAGPEQVDGLVWWKVRFDEREGWMAERSSRGVALLDRAP